MSVNRYVAEKAIKNAEREMRNAILSLEEEDYSGALKYFQEATEYVVKAVLIAYGIDYPKVHEVGRFLLEIKERFPKWFANEAQAIAEVTDSLARGRPKFRYPYEYPAEEYEGTATKIRLEVEKVLKNCGKLVKWLFKTPATKD